MRFSLTVAAVLAACALSLIGTAAASASTSKATFRGGSGFYLTSSGTDGLSEVTGNVTFSQSASGAAISASGNLSGLKANTPYVTVPYKDPLCVPAVGLTAFPSKPFTTDANGKVSFSGVTVNPQAILPVGTFDVSQTHSVSVRQVILNSINLGGIIQIPTIPNGAAVETCDLHPVITG